MSCASLLVLLGSCCLFSAFVETCSCLLTRSICMRSVRVGACNSGPGSSPASSLSQKAAAAAAAVSYFPSGSGSSSTPCKRGWLQSRSFPSIEPGSRPLTVSWSSNLDQALTPNSIPSSDVELFLLIEEASCRKLSFYVQRNCCFYGTLHLLAYQLSLDDEKYRITVDVFEVLASKMNFVQSFSDFSALLFYSEAKEAKSHELYHIDNCEIVESILLESIQRDFPEIFQSFVSKPPSSPVMRLLILAQLALLSSTVSCF